MTSAQPLEKIIMAHGGGGELTRRLISQHVLPRLNNDLLSPLADSAIIPMGREKICLTTDAFVVRPLEFPGGDIGRLAVCGTVNDLAVMGAEPSVLSLAMVMEEGLSIALLDRILESIAQAARQAGVVIGTGDTKVIEGQGTEGLTITTAGVGLMRKGITLGPAKIKAGDVIIITGPIAEHGLAVMSAREGLAFQTRLQSDVAPLNGLTKKLLDSGANIRFMRDPTRGGLAGVVADLAEEIGMGIEIDEKAIPLTPVARHTAELLGLDPLTVANEGKIVVVVAAADAEKILTACQNDSYGRHAAIVGQVVSSRPCVELVTRAGGKRIIQRPYGEELPRIC